MWWTRTSLVGVGLAVLASSCAPAGAPSVVDPAGPAAARIEGLWWWMFWLGGAVWLLVVVLLLATVLRRRRQTNPSGALLPVVLGGLVLPVLVLPLVYVLNVTTLGALPRADGEALRVEVTGKQFWWEVRYPDEGIVTANEFAIPVGRPVQLVLNSTDVIHSFWVPQLHGKIDMIPGKTNTLTVIATDAGSYHGQCAEYCGLQHALMQLRVVALPAEQYERWAARMQQPAPEPATAQLRAGQEAFLASGCAGCHTIKGTAAEGQLGPDLTHFGSRWSIGAGAAPNKPGYLGGWIVNSQTIKPGNLMPPMPVESDDLLDLIAYLESLE